MFDVFVLNIIYYHRAIRIMVRFEQPARMHLVFALCLGLGIPPIGKYTSIRTAPFHPSIHNLGNVGVSGQAHAQGAWFATWLIDQVAYGGINMREGFAQLLAQKYENGTKLLEIGCGVGTLTYELEKIDHFDIVAVDTSREMIDIAQRCIQSPLSCLNGIDYNETVDVSVVCMVMHELPPCAHRELLRHVLNITALDVWVVDIDPDYQPSLTMLSGEPYVPKYLETIEAMIHQMANESEVAVHTFSFIPGHVRAWNMQKHSRVDTH